MNGAIIYQPGMLATLHTLRDGAVYDNHRALWYALNIAIAEYISKGDGSYADLRRQAIEFYRDEAKLDAEP
jgi:hypothetical protein